jgi:hypothetical protein
MGEQQWIWLIQTAGIGWEYVTDHNGLAFMAGKMRCRGRVQRYETDSPKASQSETAEVRSLRVPRHSTFHQQVICEIAGLQARSFSRFEVTCRDTTGF